MSYEDKYGITQLIDKKIDNLTINWDCDDNPNDIMQRYPVLLFTPDMEHNKTDPAKCPKHYHIELNRENAKVLKIWLEKFLADK